jgi:hypothetical protein
MPASLAVAPSSMAGDHHQDATAAAIPIASPLYPECSS